MTPARGRCLVRKVETSESYAGGNIVLPEAVREKIAAQQVEVVAAGEPAECKDEDCERPHLAWVSISASYIGVVRRTHTFPVKPGAWVVIAPRSLVESDSPETFLVHQDDVLAILTA